MSGSGRGGNKRQGFRRRDKDRENGANGPRDTKKKGDNPRFDKTRGVFVDRPKWVPPTVPSEPIPVPDCPYCGKPIKDISAALTDKTSGEAVHFDCVLGRLAKNETLERGDTVTYIGGGRFGVVRFTSPQDTRGFTIKKIVEWENKENRSEWRRSLADHYSTT
ncbi:hypothetical protein AGMMS49944_29240 [Spirochaetia bacterium]|nr:hypothetical protein AGMMS49944_29240 [Spirochaetia bacterium]